MRLHLTLTSQTFYAFSLESSFQDLDFHRESLVLLRHSQPDWPSVWKKSIICFWARKAVWHMQQGDLGQRPVKTMAENAGMILKSKMFINRLCLQKSFLPFTIPTYTPKNKFIIGEKKMGKTQVPSFSMCCPCSMEKRIKCAKTHASLVFHIHAFKFSSEHAASSEAPELVK